MAGAMPSYRIYKLNKADRIVSGAWIDADDDPGACEAAQDLCDEETPAVEVWERARFVRKLHCDQSIGAHRS